MPAAEDERPQLEDLLQRLGVQVADTELLALALTHRSFAFEAGGVPHNERLEFLGDAVLGLAVTDLLYRRLSAAPEGRLAKLRAAAVSTSSLAALARVVRLGDFVRLGKGEEASGGRDKDSILADTLEAVIGAVYLDAGLEPALRWVGALFGPLLDDLVSRPGSLDHKTSLQELAAAELASLPTYALAEEGPDHRKRFAATVSVDGEVLGSGAGGSKKQAEQAAARQALERLYERLAVSSSDQAGRPGHYEDPGGRP